MLGGKSCDENVNRSPNTYEARYRDMMMTLQRTFREVALIGCTGYSVVSLPTQEMVMCSRCLLIP